MLPASPNPTRFAVPALVAMAGAAALWWLLGHRAAPPPPAAAPAPVVVTRVDVRDVPEYALGVGTVESLHSVILRPQVDGILNEVLFQEGEDVEAGQLLARIDDRSIVAALEQARAARNRNQAQLDSARDDLARYQSLVQNRTIAQQTVDQQKALVTQLEAAVGADDAAIAAAEVQLSFTRIESPVSGRTGIRRVDPGNLVRSAETDGLVSVTQMEPIAVVFALPQDLLPRVRELMSAPEGAPVTVFDRAGGTQLAEGTLLLIDNEINAGAGTLRLKARFANTDRALWPGQFVTARLRIGNHENALVLPTGAVQRGRDHAYVYRVDGDTVTHVPVTRGFENDEVVVITGGLQPGDIVVRDGQSRLKPGARVRILPQGPSPPP